MSYVVNMSYVNNMSDVNNMILDMRFKTLFNNIHLTLLYIEKNDKYSWLVFIHYILKLWFMYCLKYFWHVLRKYRYIKLGLENNFKPINISINDMDKCLKIELTTKTTFTKNTWYDWYDWLINYIPEPIKKL